VQNSPSNEDMDALLTPISTSTAIQEAPSQPKLTNTDAIGRGLIGDYLSIAASGNDINDKTLTELANKYINVIPTLIKYDQVTEVDIKIVPDSKENLENYASAILKIHSDYAAAVTGANTSEVFSSSNTQELYSTTKVFSSAYKTAAKELEALSVPKSVSTDHLKLINSYLSSAAAMSAVSDTESDAATAFAGLMAIRSNVAKEE